MDWEGRNNIVKTLLGKTNTLDVAGSGSEPAVLYPLTGEPMSQDEGSENSECVTGRKPAEEQPAEETPADDNPRVAPGTEVKDKPAEEQPAEETPTDEYPREAPGTEEKPAASPV